MQKQAPSGIIELYRGLVPFLVDQLFFVETIEHLQKNNYAYVPGRSSFHILLAVRECYPSITQREKHCH
jgi:hypothetical protein